MIEASCPALDAALEYRELGLSIFPVWPIRNRFCACRSKRGCKPGKHPISHLAPHGFHNATTDERLITRWFKAVPDANIGIATGEVSGVVVLDADGLDGKATLFRLGTTALTPLGVTGGGGYHQYFKHPGIRIRSRAGVLPHLDVKADGGYVVAPPSLHESGERYEWKTPMSFLRPAPLPDAVLALLLAEPRCQNGGPTDDAIAEGTRNDWLYRHGRRLASNGARGYELIRALEAANADRCIPPLPTGELLGIAASVDRRVPCGVDAELERLRGLWAAYPWRLDSDRLTVQAALDIAAKCGKLTVALSVRTVAERIGVSENTANLALRRMTDAGWLTIFRLASGIDANIYRLTVPRSCRSTCNEMGHSYRPRLRYVPSGDRCATENVPSGDKLVLVRALAYEHRNHDLWRRGALGKPCMICYAILLCMEGMTARDLAKLLGRKSHVRRHLAKLRRYGLAKPNGRVWQAVPVPSGDLDELADQFGTAGKGRIQQARNNHQRAKHAEEVRSGGRSMRSAVVRWSAPGRNAKGTQHAEEQVGGASAGRCEPVH